MLVLERSTEEHGGVRETVEREVALPDGRILSWCEWGDPDGIPVLRLHGTPGGRRVRHSDTGIYERRGARIITPARPGYSRSTRHAQLGLRSFSDDLAVLLDELDVDAVPVYGGSGGGPYTLAFCALHPERVLAASVMVGAAPLVEEEEAHIIGINAESRRIRQGGWPLLYELLAEHRERLLTDPLAGFRDAMRTAPAEDQAVLSDPHWALTFTEAIQEGLAPGEEGWTADALAMRPVAPVHTQPGARAGGASTPLLTIALALAAFTRGRSADGGCNENTARADPAGVTACPPKGRQRRERIRRILTARSQVLKDIGRKVFSGALRIQVTSVLGCHHDGRPRLERA